MNCVGGFVLSQQDCDNLWWDAFTTEFFEDDAMLTITFCLEDGPKRYSNILFYEVTSLICVWIWPEWSNIDINTRKHSPFIVCFFSLCNSIQIFFCFQLLVGRWSLGTLGVFLREGPLNFSMCWNIPRSRSTITLFPWTATNAPWLHRTANPCSHRYHFLLHLWPKF